MAKRKHRSGSSGHPSRGSGPAGPHSFSGKPSFGPPARGDCPPDRRPAAKNRPAAPHDRQPQRAERPSRGGERPPHPATPANAQDASPRAPSHAGSHPGRRRGRAEVWLYGLHAVQAALANPQRRHYRLLLTEEAATSLAAGPDRPQSLAAGLSPEVLPRDAISRVLPPGAVHQGAALLSEPLPDVALEDVLDAVGQADKAVVVILDQVTDPQNVGAILRSAAAFGALAVLVPDRHAPPETGALVKAASGAVEVVPLVRVVNLARAMEQLKGVGFWCAGLDAQASQTLAAADLTGKVALVLGAEGEGLRRLTRDHCDILLRLPISDRMESLNVSAAAAVALYELARER